MGASLREQRINTVHEGKYGAFKVIEYRDSNDLDIKFLDELGYIAEHVQWSQMYTTKNPYIRPYMPTVRNIGYLGTFANGQIPRTQKQVKDNANVKTKEYDCWYNMICRCYDLDGTVRKRNDGTIVTVCERWLCFATFIEDIRQFNNYDEWLNSDSREMHLDKDILCFLGCNTTNIIKREYSPTTCKFVPISVNSIFTRVTRDFYNGNITTIGLYATVEDMEKSLENDNSQFPTYEEITTILDNTLGAREERIQRHRQKLLKEMIEMTRFAIEEYKDIPQYTQQLRQQLKKYIGMLNE